ncbi:MAG: uracil-DNA glycosylase [Gammaproteobacteria bacterium]|uniref:uracil-DNA glycosylase n=1 Tax=Rhodoferax sp. TaxID=50421 RepID=UPI0017E5B300|nr:uracil-DNA glycosylase [Rhodoferax sp.]MBU3900591.1 uracil-DNA glycosylase [Gammaproteobacteria bacterium]MBA3059114.1 uracil-DNA glycosylase [Rhodoferax sp.]MBU3996746.1 uracil-DNA glycosylase [Gammaproteobacteria bacterium]MBU4081033.1 uracil-DNA glycosylase [Gammaproteobacteria bacterium]MBU4112074.1 uracil-DNA glycosylase [Gammaproteobacteria bacterium]
MFTSDAPHLTEWAPRHWPVAPDWQPLVERFLASEAGQDLTQFVQARLAAGAIIYPPQPLRALALSALAQVKVVILGQDPYHGPGQAEGLAFSVAPGVKPPPSLRNIFLEIAQEPLLGSGTVAPRRHGSLLAWAQQGVLLLNTCLSVEAGQPASHARRGWEALTDDVVRAVAAKDTPVVFLLWGAHAQAKQPLIAATAKAGSGARAEHLVLTANHPSPLSARRPPQPFIGCGHFGLTNAYLQQQGGDPIAW